MNNGAFGENFPYTNFHDLNLDWIIEIIKDFKSKYDHVQELIDQGIASIDSETSAKLEELSARADELEALLNAWYNTHSQDIENELTAALARFVSAANDKTAQSIASIPADYSTLAENVTKIQNIVNTQFSTIYQSIDLTTPSLIAVNSFEQGSFNADGIDTTSAEGSHAYRLRTSNYIPIDPSKTYVFSLLTASRLSFSVSFYTEPDYITPRIGATNWADMWTVESRLVNPPAGAKYARILLKYTADSGAQDFTHPLSPEDIEQYQFYFQNTNYGLNETGMIYSWGAISGTDGNIVRDNVHSVCTPLLNTGTVIIPENKAHAFVVLYSRNAYMGKINAQDAVEQAGGNWKTFTGEININKLLAEHNASFCMLAFVSDDSTDPLNNDNYNSWTTRNITFINDQNLLDYIKSLIYAGDNNYVISPEMHKIPVQSVPLNRQITGGQAFCKYNNHWFSTNGTTLYEQDENFNLLNSYTLDLGHGNSMHTGFLHPNYAYVSGWDNDKVYVVDLQTHTIINMLTLPVSGYTSCAIDDLNEIAYIFYRSSLPDTEDWYELITWAYHTGNEHIISRKKVNYFAAMQACDFYKGKILVAYGLGSTTESGITIYNTAGDVIGEYNLAQINAQEPEGIMVDREDQKLYYALANRNLYYIK